MNEVKTYAVNCNDAWLNTKGDDISGSYVKYADYLELAAQLANAESKCRELAAENTELKSDRDTLARYWIEGGGDEECANSYCEQTPATDAFLAEMRAQGVESGINTVITMMNHQHPATSQAIDILQTNAAQLRKGAAL
ncbi:hypothetical protein [Citrobacter braakii]|uniref:hypothetical protein n=1 Tax=Citrobacter braakii TaxID=57706 RepID=UPI00068BCC79|nr:hypothetical protein [Citrobacter braakii]